MTDHVRREIGFRSATGMRWEITHGSEETSNEMFRCMKWLEPRCPERPVTSTPGQEESFEVFKGALDVFVDGKRARSQRGHRSRTATSVHAPTARMRERRAGCRQPERRRASRA